MAARQTAAEILARWIETGDFPDRLLASVQADRPFVTEVVLGATRYRRLLEWAYSRFVTHDPVPPLQACLLVGTYQALIMDNEADHAVVHETVEAAKAMMGKKAGGFVNAILRRVLEARASLLEECETQPLALRESHPDALIDRWSKRLDAAQLEALCHWNNSRPGVALRINPLKTTVADYLAKLGEAGIEAEPHAFRPDAFIALSRGVAVETLPGFRTGLFTVQDPSGIVAVELLDPQPGEFVLDACAAPGGKVLAIVERMQRRGRIVALDLHEDRLGLLRQNIRRSMAPVTIKQGDARDRKVLESLGPDPLDRILLDVPCSNTGVLRRRADARWRFSEKRVKALIRTQRALLDATAPCLRPGGVLVYSTCSLEPDENEALVNAWCDANADFQLTRESRLFPPETHTDGAYAARIERHG